MLFRSARGLRREERQPGIRGAHCRLVPYRDLKISVIRGWPKFFHHDPRAPVMIARVLHVNVTARVHLAPVGDKLRRAARACPAFANVDPRFHHGDIRAVTLPARQIADFQGEAGILAMRR